MARVRRAFTVVLLTACAGCGGAAEHAPGQAPPVPVRAARAVHEDARVELRAIGTVEPYTTVAVRAQVDGQLAETYVAEGQEVRRGERLFLIDPRPVEATLRQAEAKLARDRAQADNARREHRRLARLFESGVVSRDELDRARTQAAAFEADVAADQAAVEAARIELGYTSIQSPIDGRIGQVLVHPGNVVDANETALTVINQLRPIYVAFSVPQQDLPAVRRHAAAGPLAVEAIASGNGGATPGELVFINNTVDAATGTVLLKARFPNPEEELWPGQFVDVALHLRTEPQAVVIPAQAVQTGQQGAYVFVVRDDGTVESRAVVTGQSFDGRVVVREGVAAGEQVVTEGQLRLAPGIRVAVRDGAG
jgi:multidrug efflux system membrane fusion protein